MLCNITTCDGIHYHNDKTKVKVEKKKFAFCQSLSIDTYEYQVLSRILYFWEGPTFPVEILGTSSRILVPREIKASDFCETFAHPPKEFIAHPLIQHINATLIIYLWHPYVGR